MVDMQKNMDKLKYIVNKKCLEFRDIPKDCDNMSPIDTVKTILKSGLKINDLDDKEIRDCWRNKEKKILLCGFPICLS